MPKRSLPYLLAATLAGCAGSPADPAAMNAVLAMSALEERTASPARAAIINPRDVLRVTVLQVPDLSFPELRVDTGGMIEMPLIGSIPAAGRTPADLSEDIRRRLAETYLQNPQVSVTVAEAVIPKVTIDGAVIQPGVYEMQGRTTLMQAVAMARGTSPVADARDVAVFRVTQGQRTVAVFDLAAVRRGEAVDPVLQDDDIVVVDTSRLKATFREILPALPALAIFRGY